MSTSSAGPLAGITVLELSGLGPAPFACTMLAEMGARVIRIDRPTGAGLGIVDRDVHHRSRESMVLNLKKPGAVDAFLKMVGQADVVVEAARPGVQERLGIGPDECLAANPALVYARMTGWGQTGPLAQRAGHDINYAGLTGAVHSNGAKDKPRQAVNFVADFGGGSMFLIAGILAALVERATSGKGQVVDAAMVDGASSLLGMIYGLHAQGAWRDEREANLLDGGAPYYDTYECADGRFVSVGPLEPQFYQIMMDTLQLDFDQHDTTQWPALRKALTEKFLTKTRDEWAEIFEPLDACVYPVLSLAEAPHHPHMQARGVFSEFEDGYQPKTAPKFSRTPVKLPTSESALGADSTSVLESFGFDATKISELLDSEAVVQN